jgi:dipeptidyl aminopeptidase/acylaminoacyl peptidase
VSGAAYTDNIVRVWDPLTGEGKAQLHGHVWGIEVVAYSPDGQLIATGGQDGTVRLWDAATAREVRRMEAKDGMIYAMAFAPDGKTIASGGKRKAIHLWDVATGRELRSFENPGKFVLRMAFAPDGKMLATRGIDEKEIRLWDVARGEPIRRLTVPTAGVPSLEFSPDGRTLAAGCDDGLVRLWDVRSGEERQALTVPNAAGGRVFSIAFSPDGRTLASGHGEGQHMFHTIRLWELSTRRERCGFEGHRGGVGSLAYSPDGTLLASGGLDYVAMIWDVTGQRTTHLPHQRRLNAAERNALWSELADADAPKAYRGMQTLFAAGEQAVILLRKRLHPAAALDERTIDQRIADLDSEEFAVRQKAARELRSRGDAAEPALRKSLAGKPSVEQRQRVKQLLQDIETARSPDYLRGLRAVEVLERIGTSDAQQVLQTLADGAPTARLTREAKASLERLSRRRPAKPEEKKRPPS